MNAFFVSNGIVYTTEAGEMQLIQQAAQNGLFGGHGVNVRVLSEHELSELMDAPIVPEPASMDRSRLH
jgi:hypothetical protein